MTISAERPVVRPSPATFGVPDPDDIPTSHDDALDDQAEPFTLAALFTATVERWRVVAGVTALCLAIAVLAMLLLDPVYRSRSSFVASGANSLKLPGAGGMGAGALSALASQFGLPIGGEASESPVFYEQLLESRELRTRLALARFPDPRSAAPNDSASLLELLSDSLTLGQRLGVRERDPAKRLERVVKLIGDEVLDASVDARTDMVTVTADAEWPALSAAVANRAVGLVGGFNLEQRVSRAKSRRIFVEARLVTARDELDVAERVLRAFYDQNRRWATSPTLVFEEGKLRRQVDVASDVYLSLRREFEAARIAEVNDAAIITIVDTAVAPRRAQWPQAAPTLLAATFVGLTFGIAAAVLAALAADWATRNPDAASRLRTAVRRARSEMRLRGRTRRSS